MEFISLDMQFFLFNNTAPNKIYTLSLHDALPIYCLQRIQRLPLANRRPRRSRHGWQLRRPGQGVQTEQHHPGEIQCDLFRSEEHTSELQSQSNLVCRLLLEKKKNISS